MSGRLNLSNLRYGNSSTFYNLFAKTYPRAIVAITVGAVILEYTGAGFVDRLWNRINYGVSSYNPFFLK